MSDQQALQDREKQIATLRELRKRRHEERAERPPRLLRGLDAPAVISKEEIKGLLKAEYQNLVVSLYLQLGPDKVAPEPKALVRSFHSLKTRELERRKDLIEAIPKAQKEMLTHDLKEIEELLAQYYVPHDSHTLIIFKSAGELNRVIQLPVHATDKLTIDPDPYIVPLEMILEENERVLFLEIEKQESRFQIYHFGQRQEQDRIQSFVPSDRVDDSIPGRAQRHRLTHLERHLKATAQQAYHLYNDSSFDVLVLMGEERVTHLLEEFLHATVKAQIIGRIYGSPDADPRDRKSLIENALRDHKADREIKAIADLKEHTPAEIAHSLGSVVKACNLFLVRKLIVSVGFRHQGFICKEHHYLSLEPTDCPFCGKKLVSVENLVDEMIEIARLHAVQVTIVSYHRELLTEYEGIAAVVYAPVTAT